MGINVQLHGNIESPTVVDPGLVDNLPDETMSGLLDRFVSKQYDGELYSVRSLAFVSKLQRPLWYICTSAPVKMNKLFNYVQMDVKTIAHANQLANAGYREDTKSKNLVKLISRFLPFFRMRAVAGGVSVVVLDPPALKDISSWEAAFGKVGATIAWIDENGEAHESPKLVKTVRALSDTSFIRETEIPLGEIEEYVKALAPGQTYTVKIAPAAFPKEEQVKQSRRYRNLTDRIHREMKDRHFQIIAQKRQRTTIQIRRFTDEEFAQWQKMLMEAASSQS